MDESVDLPRSNNRVVAVVVAYNRRDLLIDALTALGTQERPVDRILVVDNASTDDSAQVARQHPSNPTVLTLGKNTGGAGGFAAGIAYAVETLDAEYVWLMDDDTIPTPGALAEMLSACEQYPGRVDIAGSRVVWTDGRDHPMNTPRRRPGASKRELASADVVGAIPVRSSSFVSMLIDARAIRAHGLPIADYFIWNDDFEYSCRLLRKGTGIYVPASVVEHRTKTFGATDTDPGERFFYEVRNKIWMITRSGALTPAERILYTGSSIRRWFRTFRRSSARGVLRRALVRGFAAGLRGGPAPTRAVLEGLPPIDQDVAKLEPGAGGRR